MADELRALVVSYAFPPVGGAGVQRSVKLVKWLHEYGIQPSVLTVGNPSVPLQDPSLERDLPPDMQIFRAATLEPGYAVKQAVWAANSRAADRTAVPSRLRKLKSAVMGSAKQLLLPDPQVLWVPGALASLTRQFWGGAPPDVVLITAPPFSQFLLAPALRAWIGTGVVLDYRDEWLTVRTTYEALRGQVTAAVGAAMEKSLVRCAHVITTATGEFRESLLTRFPLLSPDRVRTITNGYDPDDFPDEVPLPPEDRFVLSYAGTVFKLTSARGLLGAIRRLHRDSPDLARLLEVRFIGRIVETECDAFEGMEALGVQRLGYVPHGEVLPRLGASHLVLCLLDDVPGVERIYPAKIFELMALGRRVLCLAPSGALTRLVERHHLGDVLPPRDEAAIARYLAAQLEAFRAGQRAPAKPATVETEIACYHRRVLAGQFAEAMREAVRLARS